MDSEQLLVVMGIIAIGVGGIWLKNFISPEARERRRRQRNYGRTVQKAHRPMVKFTVKTPEDRK